MKSSGRIAAFVALSFLVVSSSLFAQKSSIPAGFKRILTIAEPDTLSEFGKIYTRLTDIAVGKGSLYATDNLEKTVRVFDTRTGKELSPLGQKGRGPGEFESPARIRYLASFGVVVFDPILMRLTGLNGRNVLPTNWQLKKRIEDFVFLNDTLIVAGTFMMKNDHKPIELLSLNNGEVVREFGSVVEPQDGIFETIEKSGTRRYDAFPGGLKIASLSGKRVAIGQRNPYRVMIVALGDGTEKIISEDASFDTKSNNFFESGGTGASRFLKRGFGPSGGMCGLELTDNRIAAVVVSRGLHEAFIDYFKIGGEFIKRVQLPKSSYAEMIVCDGAVFDEVGSLYLLMHNFRDSICWVDKYSPIGGGK